MDNTEVTLLKKALQRQKLARSQAEQILEAKSKEYYDITQKLKQENERLANLAHKKSSDLDSVFVNIMDPYVIMGLRGNVISMNAAAKEYLGFDNEEEEVNLMNMVHKDSYEYSMNSFKILMEVGKVKNFRPVIVLKNGIKRHVQINGSLVYDKEGKPIAAQGILRDITHEIEIKQLLRDQKRQLDVIIENSPIGIVLTVDGQIIRSNSYFARLMGYAKEELISKSVKSITENNAIFEESIAMMHKMNSGEIDEFNLEKQYVKKDGTTFLANTMVSSVKDEEGKVLYQIAVIEDITERKRIEQEQRASETRLSTLIGNLQLGVLLEDENRKIRITNNQFCEMFGVSATPEQMKGADCSNAAEESKHFFKDPEEFVARINVILKAQELVLSDELETVDGRILSRDYIPIFSNNEYKGHLWTYNDVTLSKTYKRTLEAQRTKYSSIIANMNLGLVEVDLDDCVLLVNQSFCDMSGFTKKELLGKPLSKVVHVDTTIIQEHNEKRTEGISDTYEVAAQTKSGEIKYWLISGAPRYDVESGELIGSIGIHLDITDQKRLELQKEELLKELEASNQGLKDYAHIVSHDLKSPLRSVNALATWLEEDYAEKLGENGAKSIQLIQEKISGMDNLIDGILKYSRVSNTSLNKEVVDVNQVIAQIKEIIFLPEHITISVMDTLPTIKADKTQIQQVFQNLINNAAEHIDKEVGKINIGFEAIPGFWKFSVADNGIGIAEEYHKKIFDIFQSVHDKAKSTGIGLSIVKKIITLYDGKIWVESTVGKGTTFYFTFKK